MRLRTVRTLWGAAGLLLGVFLLKVFVADVYRVDSGSMRPTILGGPAVAGGEEYAEHVLVRYASEPELERFDLAVIDPRGGSDPVVKRVVGLPGESIRIADGDLFVDGRRLKGSVPRPELIPVFDDALQPVEEFFHFKRQPDGPWRKEEDGWVAVASEVAPSRSEGTMLYHPDLHDDYFDQLGRRVAGLRQVNDGALECRFRLESELGTVRFRIVEEGDTFECVIGRSPGDAAQGEYLLRLLRFNARTLQDSNPGGLELASEPLRLRDWTWHEVRFTNVDNRITFEIGREGKTLASIDIAYEVNEPHPARTGAGDKSIGPRFGFGAEGAVVRFSSVRILRDLFYTQAGEYAVGEALALAPDEYFVLGDHSAYSTDSRHFGPVHADEILGMPVLVVWPPSRIRWLLGVGPRPEE